MNQSISLKELFKRISNSFILPLVILPIAGLLMGIGGFFTTPEVINYLRLENLVGESTFLGGTLLLIKQLGSIVFLNLPLIFAVCVSGELAREEKYAASFSGLVSFLIMNQTISALLMVNNKFEPGALYDGALSTVCGIRSLQTGIFGGIVIGIIVGYIHNRLVQKNFSGFLSFFGGTRLVFLTSALVSMFVGIVFYFIWPLFQSGVYSLVRLVTSSKYAGTLLYGFIERFLKPFGLDEIFTSPFWQTALGGCEIIDSRYVTGARNIFFAELVSSDVNFFNVNAMRFMSGNFPFMMFGLPAGALAIYSTANNSKKKSIGGILLCAAIVSLIVGVTEPLEYILLFSAPLLYAIHCILVGLSFILMRLLKVSIGIGFSGGLIDFLFFGVLQGNAKTNWTYGICLGIAYAFVYYFVFRFAIRKFKLTPLN